MHSTPNLRLVTAAAVGLSAILISGCSSGASSKPAKPGEVIPAAWYATVDAQFKKADGPSRIPTIDLDAKCALDATVRVSGKGPDGFGSGASSVGDTGKRYQCEFSHPSSGLVVAKFTAEADYNEVADSLKARSQLGNKQTEETFTLAGRTIRVVRTVYPTNDTHIDYEASVVDPANKGYALLSVEASDDLKSSYTSKQAAEDFNRTLGG
jgi:hypothetical protein